MATLASPHQLSPPPIAVVGITAAWVFAVTRLCDYLSTVPFAKAMGILSLTQSGRDLGDIATTLISTLPRTYFKEPRPIMTGLRFVFDKDTQRVRMVQDPNQQIPWPTRVDSNASHGALAVLPTDAIPQRLRSLNSFMVFRSRWSFQDDSNAPC